MEMERLAHSKRLEVQRLTELKQQELHERMNGGRPRQQEMEVIEVPPASTLTKSNSVAHMFGDRIRRASDANIKRAESMKVQGLSKPVKRTPSFTTRRRGSFRTKSTGNLIEILFL